MKSLVTYILLASFVFLFACSDNELDNNNNNTHPNGIGVGEMSADSVMSALRWNDMGFTVQSGETYTFHSVSEWVDLSIVTDADGFSNPGMDLFSNLKRVPDALWFELIASVDTTNFYIIGKDTTISFNETGRIMLFGNDAEGFYGNNSGSIYTEITRTK